MRTDRNIPIISITDAAQAHIKSFMSTTGEGAGFRVALKKTGCSGYAYLVDVVEAPRENDLVLLQNGLRVFVAANSVDLLSGTQVDLETQAAGQKKLVFNNPHADHYCGCGESFTVTKEKDKLDDLEANEANGD